MSDSDSDFEPRAPPPRGLQRVIDRITAREKERADERRSAAPAPNSSWSGGFDDDNDDFEENDGPRPHQLPSLSEARESFRFASRQGDSDAGYRPLRDDEADDTEYEDGEGDDDTEYEDGEGDEEEEYEDGEGDEEEEYEDGEGDEEEEYEDGEGDEEEEYEDGEGDEEEEDEDGDTDMERIIDKNNRAKELMNALRLAKMRPRTSAAAEEPPPQEMELPHIDDDHPPPEMDVEPARDPDPEPKGLSRGFADEEHSPRHDERKEPTPIVLAPAGVDSNGDDVLYVSSPPIDVVVQEKLVFGRRLVIARYTRDVQQETALLFDMAKERIVNFSSDPPIRMLTQSAWGRPTATFRISGLLASAGEPIEHEINLPAVSSRWVNATRQVASLIRTATITRGGSIAYQFRVHIWNPPGATVQGLTVSLPTQVTGGHIAAVSRTGRLILVGTYGGKKDAWFIVDGRAEANKRLAAFEHMPDHCTCAIFSNDETKLFVATKRNGASIIDLGSGKSTPIGDRKTRYTRIGFILGFNEEHTLAMWSEKDRWIDVVREDGRHWSRLTDVDWVLTANDPTTKAPTINAVIGQGSVATIQTQAVLSAAARNHWPALDAEAVRAYRSAEEAYEEMKTRAPRRTRNIRHPRTDGNTRGLIVEVLLEEGAKILSTGSSGKALYYELRGKYTFSWEGVEQYAKEIDKERIVVAAPGWDTFVTEECWKDTPHFQMRERGAEGGLQSTIAPALAIKWVPGDSKVVMLVDCPLYHVGVTISSSKGLYTWDRDGTVVLNELRAPARTPPNEFILVDILAVSRGGSQIVLQTTVGAVIVNGKGSVIAMIKKGPVKRAVFSKDGALFVVMPSGALKATISGASVGLERFCDGDFDEIAFIRSKVGGTQLIGLFDRASGSISVHQVDDGRAIDSVRDVESVCLDYDLEQDVPVFDTYTSWGRLFSVSWPG